MTAANIVVDKAKVKKALTKIPANLRKVTAYAIHDSAKKPAKGQGKETAFNVLSSTVAEPQRIITVAALVVAEACNLTGKKLLTRTSKPFSKALFNQLTNGGGAFAYHQRAGNVGDDGLTVKGLTTFGQALEGQSGWVAMASEVRKVIGIFRKGGKAVLKEGFTGFGNVSINAQHEVVAYVKK